MDSFQSYFYYNSWFFQLDFTKLGSREHPLGQLQHERLYLPYREMAPSDFTSSLWFCHASASHPTLVPLTRCQQQPRLQLDCSNISLSDHCLLPLQLIFSSHPAPTVHGPHQDLQTIVLGTFLLSLIPSLPPAHLTQLGSVGHHCVKLRVHLQLSQHTLPSLPSAGKTLYLLHTSTPLTTCQQLDS